MRMIVLVVALVTAGCAYHAPTESTSTPTGHQPAKIFVNVVTGQDGFAGIAVRVVDSSGISVANAPVAFSVTVGSLSVTNAMTNSDGLAQTTLTAFAPSRLTVTSGTVSATADIATGP